MKEAPRYHFKRASICLQYTSELHPMDNQAFCPNFHSFETDLLSYHFQRERPLSSQLVQGIKSHDISIHFPESYAFHSEGRSQEFFSTRTIVPCKISISKTCFFDSKKVVWSIVLTNQDENFFTEYELIKLLNFVGSRQERTTLRDEIRFSLQHEAPNTLETLLTHLLDEPDLTFNLGSGILQFDTSLIEFTEVSNHVDWETFYPLLCDSLGSESDPSKLNRLYDEQTNYQNILNLLCGFSLGIFDFNRMGFDEVLDTLPLQKGDNNYLLFINRGIMLNLCHEDEMFSSVLHTIGMSPYLLIPNAVINCNTFLLEQSYHQLIGQNMEDTSTNDLLELRKTVEYTVNQGVVSNVFHYATEKNLFDFCTKERNHPLVHEKTQTLLMILQKTLDERKALREDRSDLFMTLLLTVLSCFQFQGIFQSMTDNNLLMSWIYTLTFALTITGAIYYLLKMKR